jgi:hypothetical protein
MLSFDVDSIAYRIAYDGESVMSALDLESVYDYYFRLDKHQKKALKIAIFERCIAKLKEEEEP